MVSRRFCKDAEILHNRPVGLSLFVLGIGCNEIASRCRPGHFVMVTVAGGCHPVLPRPFSVFRLLDDKGDALAGEAFHEREGAWEGASGVEILCQVVGEGTAILERLAPGDSVGLLGPCGSSLFPPAREGGAMPDHAVMVAGGVGVAPLFFQAMELGSSGVSVDLFYGGRSGDYLLELDGLPSDAATLHLVTEDGSLGETGFVTDALDRWLESRGPIPGLQLFACGPESMLLGLMGIANRHPLPAFFSMEQRMGCAVGACRGCVIRADLKGSTYARVCSEGPVFSLEELAPHFAAASGGTPWRGRG